MTAVQIHAELFRTMGEIADDEGLMMKLLKYAKKLAAKKNDPTLMTKEEFFARVDEAKKEPSKRFANVAELDQYIRQANGADASRKSIDLSTKSTTWKSSCSC